MKRIYSLIALVLVLSMLLTGCFGSKKSDEELIESRINTFIKGYNSGNMNSVLKNLDAKTRNELKAAMNITQDMFDMKVDISDLFSLGVGLFSDGDTLEIDILSVEKQSEKEATAYARISYKDSFTDESDDVMFELVKEGKSWYISDLKDAPDGSFPTDSSQSGSTVSGSDKTESQKVSFSMNVDQLRLTVGTTREINPTIKGASLEDVTWRSSNENVAIVKRGVVVAVGSGYTIISATVKGESDYCEVWVEPSATTDYPDYPSYPDYPHNDKDYRYATQYLGSEVSYWSKEDIQIAINEIFARNHYHFKDDWWNDYFEQFDWYYSNTSDMEVVQSRLNEIELANYRFLAEQRDD